MSAKRAGVVFAAGLMALAGVLIGLYVTLFLAAAPAAVAAKPTGPRRASITLQSVAQIGRGPNPDWVSYFARDPQGRWVHSTILKLPAHALVTVTIYQYDTATGLRNPLWGQPRGVVGNVIDINGKPTRSLAPDLTSHTFAIPELGVSVPLEGIADDAKNQCSIAPCGLDVAHNTIRFQFRTGAPGKYRWQCFVPCAAGFILGFGGPMQSIGYMDGEIEVQ